MKPDSDMTSEHERISALADGALADAEFEAALRSLEAPEARECWHVYQLIGDVLRAPGLAAWDRGIEADPAWERLGREPAVAIEPTAAVRLDRGREAANDGVFRWKLVAGLASVAAFAALGWGLLGSLGPVAVPEGPQLALQQAAPASASPEASPARTPQALLAAGAAPESAPVMLRDPELDRLLAAHQQSSGVSAFGNPAGFLRSATFEGPGR